MRWECNGRTYHSADMRTFRTSDPLVPLIFLTRDGRSTFVFTRQPDGTVSAHRAGTGEIIALSHRHGIAGLLGAFPSTFAYVSLLPLGSDQEVETPSLSQSGTRRATVLT
jgi:hypothetical protein